MIASNFLIFKLSKSYPLRPSQLSLIDTLTIGLPATILTILPNNKPIQGKFMFNVLKNALPGALVVLFNAAIIYFCHYYFEMDVRNDSIPTMITIVTAATCLLVLLRVFFPINGFKVLLFISVAIIMGFLIFNDLSLASRGEVPSFGFVALNFSEAMLVIVLCEAAYPLIWIFSLSFTTTVKKFLQDNYNSWVNRESEEDDDFFDNEEYDEVVD